MICIIVSFPKLLVCYYVGSFSAHTSTRDLWVGRSHWRSGAISFFLAEIRGRVGGGVFGQELFINSNFRLPDYCSVFQAEGAAIKIAVYKYILLRSAQWNRRKLQADELAAEGTLTPISVSWLSDFHLRFSAGPIDLQ